MSEPTRVIITPTVIARLTSGKDFVIAKLNAVLIPDERIIVKKSEAIQDAPLCKTCGSLMTPNGSCYKCENCGSTSGCS
jgi:tRNA(Ile2) C34 agmatinyltransferase TiaS